MCSFGSTEFNLYSVRHSKAAIGSFITRIFAELCIILREINHPLTDGLCIISWRTNSVGQYTESRRLYSLLLGMEYGWSTSSAMYYTSDRARTLVAREVVLRLLQTWKFIEKGRSTCSFPVPYLEHTNLTSSFMLNGVLSDSVYYILYWSIEREARRILSVT